MKHWEEARIAICDNDFTTFKEKYSLYKNHEAPKQSPGFFDKEIQRRTLVDKNTLLRWERHNNKEIIRHLISDGADPSIALLNAAVADDRDFIDELLTLGANGERALNDIKFQRANYTLTPSRFSGEEYLIEKLTTGASINPN